MESLTLTKITACYKSFASSYLLIAYRGLVLTVKVSVAFVKHCPSASVSSLIELSLGREPLITIKPLMIDCSSMIILSLQCLLADVWQSWHNCLRTLVLPIAEAWPFFILSATMTFCQVKISNYSWELISL